MSKKRIVLIGTGHAHLYTIKRAPEIARNCCELTVVAPDHFWYSGLATGMLGGTYSPELDQIDVAALIGPHGRFLRDEAVSIDPAGRRVALKSGACIDFDALSIDVGSEPPPLEGMATNFYSVKPIRGLLELQRNLKARLAHTGPQPVTVVVAGGGITAFELAGNIEHLTASSGPAVHIVVLPGDNPLRQLPRRAVTSVIDELSSRGIEIRTGIRVEHVDDGRVQLSDGSELRFQFLMNATGLRPSSSLRGFGLPLDRHGALIVNDELTSDGAPGIFGGGDCIAIDGRPLPHIGVFAIRQAPILYHNLLAALDGKPLRSFRPQKRYLTIMNLGRGRGLAFRGGLWWHGRLAFIAKDWIDRRFLRRHRPD